MLKPTHENKILIVDDIEPNVNLLYRVLESDGYESIKAYSGKEALQQLENHQVDLILLDVLMPGMTGFEVCSKIKENKKTQDIPVIFITAKSDSESAIEGLQLGAVDYITKPFNRSELIARIKTHLELKNSKEKLEQELKERKAAEELLRITTNRLELALIAGSASWWDWDTESNNVTYNRLPEENKPNAPQNSSFDDFIFGLHDDDRDRIKKQLLDFATGTESAYDVEYRIKYAANQWKWVHDKGQVVSHLPNGNPKRIIGVMNDITEQINARQKLAESEFKFRTIADYTYDWEFWLSPDAKIRYISPACKRISGYSQSEFLQSTRLLFKIIHADDKKKFKDNIRQALKGEITYDLDYRIFHKDGSVKWVSLVSQPIMDYDGKFQGTRGSLRDITQRKHAEKIAKDKKEKLTLAYRELIRYNNELNATLIKLRKMHTELEESRQLYRTLVSNLPDTDVYVFDTDMKLMIVEGQQLSKYGINSDDYTGHRLTDFVDNQYKYYFDAIFRAALNGTTISQEFKFQDDWFYHQVVPLKEQNRITGGLFVMRNISEQKKAIKDLVESETKYRRVVENAPDGIVNFDLEGVITDINKPFNQMMLCERDELPGKNLREMVPGSDIHVFDKMINAAISGKQVVAEMHLINKEGHIFPVEINSKIIVEKSEIQGFVRDITERKKAERLLKTSEEKFSKVFHMSPESIIILNAETGKVIDLNKSAGKTFAGTREKYIGKTDVEIKVWETIRARREMVKKIRQNGEIYGYEAKLKRSNGELFYGLISGRLFEFKGEKCIITTVQDITEKKQTQEIVIAERQRFLTLLEKFPSFVCVVDIDMKIKYANSKFKSLFGETNEMLCYQKMRKGSGKCQPCMLDKVMKNKQDTTSEWTDDNGRTYLVQASYFADTDANPQLLEVGLDITERKIAEEGVKKALKKEKQLSELKSRFISTVSHEFRTPMTLIKSNTQMLEKFDGKLPAESRKKSFHRIYEAIKSINMMLSNTSLIEDGKHNTMQYNPVEIDFDEFCDEITDELNSIANNNVEIKKITKNNIGNVLIDVNLLRHILNNVLTNAQKFSRKDSIIQFITEKQTPEDNILLTVKDNGIGIAEEDLQFIFDPFHRGKNTESIRGTGLGMAIVKRNIDLINGKVAVYSKINEGTTVQLEIPIEKKN